MVDAPSLPPHLIIDGNNLLCWKVVTRPDGQYVNDHRGRDELERAPLSVRENAFWFRQIKHGVSEPTSAADFHTNLKAPNLRLLNNLMCFVAEQQGWSCTLFTDTTFEPLVRSANKRSPEMGFANLWAEMKKAWGPHGRNWIQPRPEKSGDGTKAQADHHLLAAARLYKETRDVLIVSNDQFSKRGEGEKFPDLFPPGDLRGRILVKFSMGADETAVFNFPDPYVLLVLPINKDKLLSPAPDQAAHSSGGAESGPPLQAKTGGAYFSLPVAELQEVQVDGMSLRAMSEHVVAQLGDSRTMRSIKIGTGEQCQMRVDPARYPHISALHLELRVRSDGVWEAIDHGKNGTYLADFRLPQAQPVELPEHGLLALSMPNVESERCVKLLFRVTLDQKGLSPFMRSRRPERAGRPDTEFFWLSVDGKDCIGKAMNATLGPQVTDLVENERQVLRLLAKRNAPVCQLVADPDHPDWLVTEFAGLSLQLLGDGHPAGWPSLTFQERVSVWAHFLRKAQALADLGAVPLDLAERNLVVPIGSSGHLQLNEAVSIDHAHTVLPSARLPGGELRRPVWIDASKGTHLAPEIRACLKRDLEKFLTHLNAAGAPLPGTTAAVLDPGQLSARTWLAYDAPQSIQQRINDGSIEADKAIQYAVGEAIHRRLTADSPYTSRIAPVVRRMCAQDPNQRFKELVHAADALKSALDGKLALASIHVYRASLPGDLIPQAEEAQQPISLGNYNVAGSNPAPGGEDGDSDDDIMYVEVSAQQEPDSAVPSGVPQAQSTTRSSDFAASDRSAAGQQHAGGLPLQDGLGADWRWHLAAVVLALATGIPLGLWFAGQ